MVAWLFRRPRPVTEPGPPGSNPELRSFAFLYFITDSDEIYIALKLFARYQLLDNIVFPGRPSQALQTGRLSFAGVNSGRIVRGEV